jgi:hypothetical protein
MRNEGHYTTNLAIYFTASWTSGWYEQRKCIKYLIYTIFEVLMAVNTHKPEYHDVNT